MTKKAVPKVSITVIGADPMDYSQSYGVVLQSGVNVLQGTIPYGLFTSLRRHKGAGRVEYDDAEMAKALQGENAASLRVRRGTKGQAGQEKIPTGLSPGKTPAAPATGLEVLTPQPAPPAGSPGTPEGGSGDAPPASTDGGAPTAPTDAVGLPPEVGNGATEVTTEPSFELAAEAPPEPPPQEGGSSRSRRGSR